jgi:hypothetical protein
MSLVNGITNPKTIPATATPGSASGSGADNTLPAFPGFAPVQVKIDQSNQLTIGRVSFRSDLPATRSLLQSTGDSYSKYAAEHAGSGLEDSANAMKALAMSFDKIDKNADGQLDLSELQATMALSDEQGKLDTSDIISLYLQPNGTPEGAPPAAPAQTTPAAPPAAPAQTTPAAPPTASAQTTPAAPPTAPAQTTPAAPPAAPAQTTPVAGTYSEQHPEQRGIITSTGIADENIVSTNGRQNIYSDDNVTITSQNRIASEGTRSEAPVIDRLYVTDGNARAEFRDDGDGNILVYGAYGRTWETERHLEPGDRETIGNIVMIRQEDGSVRVNANGEHFVVTGDSRYGRIYGEAGLDIQTDVPPADEHPAELVTDLKADIQAKQTLLDDGKVTIESENQINRHDEVYADNVTFSAGGGSVLIDKYELGAYDLNSNASLGDDAGSTMIVGGLHLTRQENGEIIVKADGKDYNVSREFRRGYTDENNVYDYFDSVNVRRVAPETPAPEETPPVETTESAQQRSILERVKAGLNQLSAEPPTPGSNNGQSLQNLKDGIDQILSGTVSDSVRHSTGEAVSIMAARMVAGLDPSNSHFDANQNGDISGVDAVLIARAALYYSPETTVPVPPCDTDAPPSPPQTPTFNPVAVTPGLNDNLTFSMDMGKIMLAFAAQSCTQNFLASTGNYYANNSYNPSIQNIGKALTALSQNFGKLDLNGDGKGSYNEFVALMAKSGTPNAFEMMDLTA